MKINLFSLFTLVVVISLVFGIRFWIIQDMRKDLSLIRKEVEIIRKNDQKFQEEISKPLR